MAPLTLHDAEQIREVIVQPIIERLDERNAELHEALSEMTARVVNLEDQVEELKSFKGRMMMLSVAIGAIWGSVWGWISPRLFGNK